MTIPSHTKILVLGEDYMPLNIVHWKRGLLRTFSTYCDECLGKGSIRGKKCQACNGMGELPPANVVANYKLTLLDSKGREHILPAVIANIHHVNRTFKNVPYSKANILKRDQYTCQYCGQHFVPSELTMDHVVPRSIWRGSESPTCWKNIVAACKPCNNKKADRTPEQAGMQLRKMINGVMVPYKYPKKPSYQDMVLGLAGRHIPEEWLPYLKTS